MDKRHHQVKQDNKKNTYEGNKRIQPKWTKIIRCAPIPKYLGNNEES